MDKQYSFSMHVWPYVLYRPGGNELLWRQQFDTIGYDLNYWNPQYGLWPKDEYESRLTDPNTIIKKMGIFAQHVLRGHYTLDHYKPYKYQEIGPVKAQLVRHDFGGGNNNAKHVNFWISYQDYGIITNDIDKFMARNTVGLHMFPEIIQVDDLGNGPILIERIENTIINTPYRLYWRRLRDDEIMVNARMFELMPRKTGRYPAEFKNLIIGKKNVRLTKYH